jgi:hypothetical protein
MLHRGLPALGGALVFALVLGAAAVGANPFGTASKPKRIDIITRATAINNFVDVGPAGPSTGDLYVFVEDVFRAGAATRRVGRADGRCILIDPTSGRFGCTIITSLARGEITTEGTFVNTPGESSKGSVTGGTRDFRNSRGDAVLDLGPPEGPHRVTFRLILAP